MKTIDHDPNEPPRPLKGEATFVTVVTVIVLVGLGLSLKWVVREYGAGVFAIVCLAILAVIFPLAFWLERTKGRSL